MQPNSFHVAPLPPSPNFNVDFWKFMNHLSAKIDISTLKMGGGGLDLFHPLEYLVYYCKFPLKLFTFANNFVVGCLNMVFLKQSKGVWFWHLQPILRLINRSQ